MITNDERQALLELTKVATQTSDLACLRWAQLRDEMATLRFFTLALWICFIVDMGVRLVIE